MLVAGLAVIVGLAAGLLLGRRPAAQAGGLTAGPGTALLAGGLVAAVVSRATPGGWAVATAIASYLALGGFAVRHRAHPGMTLIAVGLASNLVVVAADDGMPVRTLAAGTVDGLHHGLSTSDHLRGLADVISVPGLHTAASAGDLVIAAGAAVAAFAWLAAPAQHPGRPQAKATRPGPPARDA